MAHKNTKIEDAQVAEQDSQSKVDEAESKGFDMGALFWGLLFVLVGTLFLLNNIGYISVNFDNVLRMWPLLLIAIGVSLFTFRGLVPKMVGVLMMVVLLGVAGLAAAGYIQPSQIQSEIETKEASVAMEGDEAEAARISIETGAGKLKVDSDDIDSLVQSRLESSFANLQQSSITRDGVQEVKISTEGSTSWFGNNVTNDLFVTLNRARALELDVDFGVADAHLDLTDTLLRKLTLDIGASKAEVRLGGREEEIEVEVDAGMSSIVFEIPNDSGVRVQVEAGLSNRDVGGLREVSDGAFESEGFDKAERKVIITGDIGMANLEIERY